MVNSSSQLIFDRVGVQARKVFARYMLESMTIDESQFADMVARDLVLELRSYALAHDLENHTTTVHFKEAVSYPATWWQMFKDQYFPLAWKHRWPIELTMKTIEVDRKVTFKKFAMYPDADIPVPLEMGSPVYKTTIRVLEYPDDLTPVS